MIGKHVKWLREGGGEIGGKGGGNNGEVNARKKGTETEQEEKKRDSRWRWISKGTFIHCDESVRFHILVHVIYVRR